MTVLLLTPVIVSVCEVPSISVPVIVKVTDAILFELAIVKKEFNPVADPELVWAPSRAKLPALPNV